MRVRFRILLFESGKRLNSKDLKGKRDPLYIGMRYITEFKYLEASKWLLLAEDCKEKFLLLYLVNLALGQEDQAKEFLEKARTQTKRTKVEIFIERPGEDRRKVDL